MCHWEHCPLLCQENQPSLILSTLLTMYAQWYADAQNDPYHSNYTTVRMQTLCFVDNNNSTDSFTESHIWKHKCTSILFGNSRSTRSSGFHASSSPAFCTIILEWLHHPMGWYELCLHRWFDWKNDLFSCFSARSIPDNSSKRVLTKVNPFIVHRYILVLYWSISCQVDWYQKIGVYASSYIKPIWSLNYLPY